MAEEPNEHRFNTYQTIQKRLNNVGIDTSKLDEVDFSTLSRLAGEYKKAALAGAVVGAVVVHLCLVLGLCLAHFWVL